jgi:hypothetical protein
LFLFRFLSTGGDADSYAKDPAGYSVQSRAGASHTFLFRFEKPQERHLFLNVVSRASADLVLQNNLERIMPSYYDKQASPGLAGDAAAGVVSAIRLRFQTKFVVFFFLFLMF